ncbi:MAG TPA: TonB family protein [Longimicrobium sp.]|jgi:TonB family protein
MIAWLVYALAFSALLALAALAAEALLRMYGRPTRWVWVGAILLSCAGPFALAERPRQVAVSFAPVATAGADLPAAPAVRRAPPLSERVERVLPALWMATSALLVAGIAAGVAVLWRRRRGWRAARLADVSVLLSHEVGPAVVGVVRPAIVVPRWTLDWAEPMQRLVVRHEGEHIRARDPLLILAATVAAALVPWNLALWFQLRRLRLAVEVDCDARTLRGGGDVATYGDLLLRVGARGSAAALASAAFAEPRSFLERRIRAMTDRTPRNRAARAAACAVLTLCVAATGYALPAPAHPALFASLFPAEDADPIRVRAALTQPDTIPVYDIAQVERKPSLRNASEITQGLQRAYPAHLRDSGIGGTVLVEMVVQPSGTVAQARVVNTTHPELQEPARTVALTMRFAPGEVGGEPVGVRVQIPITFQPEGAAVTLTAPGRDMEPSRASSARTEAVSVPTRASSAQTEAVSVPTRASGAQTEAATVPSRASSARTEVVSVPSRAATRVDTIVVPSTTTGEVLPASAGISTRGWAPTRTTAPTRAQPRSLAPTQTTVMVTTAPTKAAIARGVAPARTTVLTTTVPTRRSASSRAVTTAAAPAHAETRAQTSTRITTARTTKVAPARATSIAPVRARPSRARKADPTPELLGRVIDPNAPRVPPAPAQP